MLKIFNEILVVIEKLLYFRNESATLQTKPFPGWKQNHFIKKSR